MAATLPFAPTSCTFDARGLFTQGEFRCYQSTNPCLNLFTHGEFPRAAAVARTKGRSQQPGVGNAGRRRIKPELIIPCKNDDIIALTLLMAEEDDDWW